MRFSIKQIVYESWQCVGWSWVSYDFKERRAWGRDDKNCLFGTHFAETRLPVFPTLTAKWHDCSGEMHMISLKSLGSLFSGVQNQMNIIRAQINKIWQEFTIEAFHSSVKNDYFKPCWRTQTVCKITAAICLYQTPNKLGVWYETQGYSVYTQMTQSTLLLCFALMSHQSWRWATRLTLRLVQVNPVR